MSTKKHRTADRAKKQAHRRSAREAGLHQLTIYVNPLESAFLKRLGAALGVEWTSLAWRATHPDRYADPGALNTIQKRAESLRPRPRVETPLAPDESSRPVASDQSPPTERQEVML